MGDDTSNGGHQESGVIDAAFHPGPVPKLVWFFVSLAGAFVAIVYCWAVVTGAALPDGSGGTRGMDFRDTVWLPLRFFFDGGVPWNVNAYVHAYPFAQFFPLYFPSYWLPSALFLLLPYRVCLLVWTLLSSVVLSLVTLAAFRRVAPSMLRRAPWAPALVILLFAFTRPGRAGLTAANWALPGACAAAYLLVAAKNSRSTLLATVVTFIKPQLGLAMAAQMAIARRWKLLVRACVVSVALALPPVVILLFREGGIGGLLHDVRATLALGDGQGYSPDAPTSTRIDAIGMLGHLMVQTPSIVDVLLMILVACATFGVWLLAARRLGTFSAPALLSAGLALCIVLPNQIYAVPTILPGIVALWRDIFQGGGRRRWMAVLGQVLVAPAFLLSGPVPGWLALTPQWAAFLAGLALHAAAAWCALSLVVFRPTEAGVRATVAGLAR